MTMTQHKRDIVLEGRAAGCRECPRTEGLHYHHRDPSTKLFQLADAHRYTAAEVRAEMDKCDVLCVSCHIAVHALIDAGAPACPECDRPVPPSKTKPRKFCSRKCLDRDKDRRRRAA